MPRFEHLRHKPPAPLDRPRELVVACAPMRSNINLSRIVRTAGCCGVRRVICCGAARVIGKIARDSVGEAAAEGLEAAPAGVEIEVHRTLLGPLRQLKRGGAVLVGLEQTTHAESLLEFRFARNTVLVVGNERTGLEQPILDVLDHVVELPVWGRPHSYNVATATAMALYEYCRQYPRG